MQNIYEKIFRQNQKKILLFSDNFLLRQVEKSLWLFLLWKLGDPKNNTASLSPAHALFFLGRADSLQLFICKADRDRPVPCWRQGLGLETGFRLD